ncbi:MAG: FAD-dependent oxidoreductase [Acidobacteriota bacterium]
MKAYDVVVVGAGIVGAACARELAAADRRVLVVEAESGGGGITAAGMGHLVVLDGAEWEFELTRYSLRLWDEWIEELPPAAEYRRCGTLWVAETERQWRFLQSRAKRFEAAGVGAELLEGEALRAEEPRLAPGLPGGLLVPSDGVLYPPVAARTWLDAALRAGAEVRCGVRAVSVGHGAVRLGDGTKLACGRIVVAAGLELPQLLPGCPVVPRKGHLAITERYPGFLHHQCLEVGYLDSAHGMEGESVAFNVQPRATGQLLVGSSRQPGRRDRAVDRRLLARMFYRAKRFLPEIERLEVVRIWTGVRAATPDGPPLIGPWPGDPTVLVAGGFEGLGITLAPAAARIVAALEAGVTPPVSPEPYLPARFSQGA